MFWRTVGAIGLCCVAALGFGVAVVLSGGQPARAADHGNVLVLVAHPDDEALGFAGIIESAVSAGRHVYVAVVTNGDAARSGTSSGVCGAAAGNASTTAAYGLERDGESIHALSMLGLTWSTDPSTSDIFFLGYPDGGGSSSAGLTAIANSATPWTGDQTGLHHTYAEDGDGSNATCNGDFHYLMHGTHAQLDAADLSGDIADLLELTHPTDIYTHSVFEGHPDHSEVGAVALAAAAEASWPIEVHTTLIHPTGTGSCLYTSALEWPNPAQGSPPAYTGDPHARFTPTIGFDAPPAAGCANPPIASTWGQDGTPRAPDETVPVPSDMQSTDEASNKKWQVISAYTSQTDCSVSAAACGYARAFVKNSEIFWTTSFAGTGTLPTTTTTPTTTAPTTTTPATTSEPTTTTQPSSTTTPTTETTTTEPTTTQSTTTTPPSSGGGGGGGSSGGGSSGSGGSSGGGSSGGGQSGGSPGTTTSHPPLQYPDLSVEITADQAVAPAVGGDVVLRIAVSSAASGGGASNVIADVTLPPDFAVASAVSDQGSGCAADGSGLVCGLGAIAPGADAHIIVRGTVGASGPQGFSARVRPVSGPGNGEMATITLAAAPPAAASTVATAPEPKITLVRATATRKTGRVAVLVRISGVSSTTPAGTTAARLWAIDVDGKRNAVSRLDARGVTSPLAPGTHRIRVELLRGNGGPVRPRARSRTVAVRVPLRPWIALVRAVPRDGKVTVWAAVKGWKLDRRPMKRSETPRTRRASGYWVVEVDGKRNAASRLAHKVATSRLAPGRYRIRIELVREDGRFLTPRARSRVVVVRIK